jgi:hypothetical protein
VGRKVVWFQTAFGHARNCVFVRGHRPRSHPRRGQEKGANANSEPSLKREGKVAGIVRPVPEAWKGLCLIRR